jgi:dTDP-4-dehydrorhamnose reductase
MKILILGSKGMLGSYAFSYLSKFYEVKSINREILDASNCDELEIEKLLIQYSINSDDVVINCIGTIKPTVDLLGDLNAIKVNSVFPRMLSNVCEKLKINLIHPSTDCVFNGDKGNYDENYVHDVTDIYGRTKSLGEPTNCMILRTSIIGEEIENQRSLIEWIKSQKNQSVNGFTDHLWNGVTCLEWSKFVHYTIETKSFWVGVRHICSPNYVNKYELVKMISDSFNLNLSINKVKSNNSIDRTLSSIYKIEYQINDLKTQIKELQEYSKEYYNSI